MATEIEMQFLEQSGEVRTFLRDSGETVRGRVLGKGTAVVATSKLDAARVWIIRDEDGNEHHVWHGEWEIVPE